MTDHRNYILRGERLSIRFVLESDRYAHVVELADGDTWIALLQSVEGSPTEAWPASPPFQSVHLDTSHPEKQIALLVGMAGRSHWSASVELDLAASRVTFDVACRIPANEQATLTSTYRASMPAAMHNPQRAQVFVPGERRRGLNLMIIPCNHARLETTRDLISVRVDDRVLPAARTARWQYTIDVHADEPADS